MNTNGPLIIGVGNLYRRDDAAGIAVIRKLKERVGERAALMEHTGEGVTLMEAWKTRDRVVLVDAVSSGAAAGALHRVDAIKNEFPVDWFSCSTHNFGVAEAVELARSLGQLPRQLHVIGIEGLDFSPGEGFSAEVEKTVDQVVEELEKIIINGGPDGA